MIKNHKNLTMLILGETMSDLHAAPARPVTEHERDIYQRDGVVLLRQIYPAAWVAKLSGLLDEVFTLSPSRAQAHEKGVLTGDSQQGSSSDMVALIKSTIKEDLNPAIEGQTKELGGVAYVETDASNWHAGMRQHNVTGPLGEIIHQLTAAEEVVLYSDQLFYKGPGSQVKTPFHQDKPYFLVSGGDMAVAWVTVDQVDRRNSAMGYVRGSHRWGKTFKPSDFQTETGTFPEVGGIDLSGLDTLDHSRLRAKDIVYFDAEPGDVIVHHWATLHGSTGNTSASRGRRAASVRFALDGCVFYARPSSPEPFRHTIGLADGEPLTASKRFKQVWPRPGDG